MILLLAESRQTGNSDRVAIDCHSEQALFAPRGIWASRAKRRVLCDAIIARLASFVFKLPHQLLFRRV